MRRSGCILSAFLVFTLLPLAASMAKADCVSYGEYLHPLGALGFPGWPRGMVYEEPYLFMATDDDAFLVADVSDPAFMEVVASLDLPAGPRALALQGSIAYLVLNDDTLRLIDVTQPDSPAWLGTIELPCSSWGVDVSGNHAFVVAWEYDPACHELFVVDVTDPLAPQLSGAVEVGTYPSDVAVAGDRAYVLDWDVLRVLDVSDPKNPSIIGELAIPGVTDQLLIADERLYILCYGGEYPAIGNGLYIVNIDDPDHPWIEGRLAEDNVAFCGIALWNEYAIVSIGERGLSFVDISDPARPVIARSAGVTGCPRHLVVTGSTLLADPGYLASYDLGNGRLAEPRAAIPLTDASRYLAAGADYGYAVRSGGPGALHVIDMSNPEKPQVAGTLELDLQIPCSFAIDGGTAPPGYAYVGGRRDDTDEIDILDISDPAAPRYVDRVVVPDNASDLDVEGGYLYAPCGYASIRIYDLADPEAPALAGSVGFTYSVQLARAVGTTLYVGSRVQSQPGLFIVDVSDPADPQVIGSSWLPRGPYDFWIESPLLYVADFEGGLLILDIGDPGDPQLLSRLSTARRAEGIWVADDVAYVADSQPTCGIQMIDVSDPRAPFVIGYLQADRACDLVRIHDHLLVGRMFDPLLVASPECGAPTARDGAPPGAPGIKLELLSNPCTSSAAIELRMGEPADVGLCLYDALGRRVRQLHRGPLAAGVHLFRWDGRDQRGRPVAAGSYFARLAAGASVAGTRLVLLR